MSDADGCAAAQRTVTQTRRSLVTSGPVRPALLALALPVLAEQVLNTFVGLFDTWLAGQISAAATAAIGLGAYVAWLAAMMVMLVGTGTTALVSRHEGAGRHGEANHDMNQSMTLAAALGLCLLALMYALAPGVAQLANLTGHAGEITVHYLRVDALGHVFMSITLVGCAALRGVGDMRTPMVLFGVINAVNVAASCFYVYGLGLGVRGIVGGTVTARVVGAIVLIAILVRGRSGLRLRWSQLRIAADRTWRILRIGIPAAVDGAIMWSGHFALVAVISRLAVGAMGEANLAAHIIAVRVEALTYLPATAWAAATATMTGQSLGAGNPARAKRAGHEGVLQCGLLSLGIGAFFFFGADWIYENMSVDPLVRAAGAGPFRLLAVFQPCMAVSIVYIGGLRGAGDTRSPLAITVVGVLIRLCLGYHLGITCGLGLVGAWTGMMGDMLWRAVAATIRYARGNWLATRI